MKDYTVIYQEVIEHEFELEAESFEDLQDVFERATNNCELSFMHGYPTDCTITKAVCLDTGETERWDTSHAELERICELFKAYLAKDEKAAGADYVYDALGFAGCTDEDIRMLGFGHCIPQERKEASAC